MSGKQWTIIDGKSPTIGFVENDIQSILYRHGDDGNVDGILLLTKDLIKDKDNWDYPECLRYAANALQMVAAPNNFHLIRAITISWSCFLQDNDSRDATSGAFILDVVALYLSSLKGFAERCDVDAILQFVEHHKVNACYDPVELLYAAEALKHVADVSLAEQDDQWNLVKAKNRNEDETGARCATSNTYKDPGSGHVLCATVNSCSSDFCTTEMRIVDGVTLRVGTCSLDDYCRALNRYVGTTRIAKDRFSSWRDAASRVKRMVENNQATTPNRLTFFGHTTTSPEELEWVTGNSREDVR